MSEFFRGIKEHFWGRKEKDLFKNIFKIISAN